MVFLFNIITAIFDIVLFPFRGLPPVVGLAFLALCTAVFALLVYKNVSNQEAIKQQKKRIIGNFFGIYLFRDDLGRIIREFLRVLGSIFRYLRYVLPPLLVIIVPVLLLCAQMQLRYGYRSLRAGEEVNVTLGCVPGVDLLGQALELSVPAEVEVLTPPLRISSREEAVWRVRVRQEGDYSLAFRVGEAVLPIMMKADRSIGPIYPLTARSSFAYIVGAPGGEVIPDDGPFLFARIDYPSREIDLGVIRLHWSIVFLILALGIGLLLKKPLKVDF